MHVMHLGTEHEHHHTTVYIPKQSTDTLVGPFVWPTESRTAAPARITESVMELRLINCNGLCGLGCWMQQLCNFVFGSVECFRSALVSTTLRSQFGIGVPGAANAA